MCCLCWLEVSILAVRMWRSSDITRADCRARRRRRLRCALTLGANAPRLPQSSEHDTGPGLFFPDER